MMYGYSYGSDFAFMHAFGWIFWILIIILVLRLIFGRHWKHGRFLNGCDMCSGHTHGHDRAMDVLKERYAKGEIDKAEFESKKKDLLG